MRHAGSSLPLRSRSTLLRNYGNLGTISGRPWSRYRRYAEPSADQLNAGRMISLLHGFHRVVGVPRCPLGPLTRPRRMHPPDRDSHAPMRSVYGSKPVGAQASMSVWCLPAWLHSCGCWRITLLRCCRLWRFRRFSFDARIVGLLRYGPPAICTAVKNAQGAASAVRNSARKLKSDIWPIVFQKLISRCHHVRAALPEAELRGAALAVPPQRCDTAEILARLPPRRANPLQIGMPPAIARWPRPCRCRCSEF